MKLHVPGLAIAATLILAASGCSEAAGTTSGSPSGSTKPAPSSAPKPSASVAKTTPAPSASAAPAAEPGDDLKVVALKITSSKETIELKEDGTVVAGGKDFGKFTKNEFKTTDGKHSLTVLKSGSVLFDGKDEGAKFNEKNELVGVPRIGSMFVADDGAIVFKDTSGKEMPAKEKVTVTGFKPEARRTTELLMLAIVASASDPAPASSSGPATSAGPATKTPPPS